MTVTDSVVTNDIPGVASSNNAAEKRASGRMVPSNSDLELDDEG